MGLFDRILGRKPQPQAPEIKQVESTDAQKGLWGAGGTTMYRYTPPTEIEKMLETATSASMIDDPRLNLTTSRMMVTTLPCFSNAVGGFVSLKGRPVIVCDDEGFKREIEENLWPNLRLHGEKIDLINYNKGIQSIADSLLSRALIDGIGAYQLVDESQAMITERGQIPIGVRVIDSVRLCPEEYTPDVIEWKYTRQGLILPFTRSKTEGMVTIADQMHPESRWFKQITYDSRFLAHWVLAALVSRRREHVRMGSPSSITTIGLNPPSDLTNIQLSEMQAKYVESLTPIKEAYQKSIQNLNDTGRPFDMVMSMAVPITIDSRTFGNGNTPFSGWYQEVREIYKTLCTNLKWPISLQGMSEGSGFNQDQFAIERKQAEIESAKHQDALGSELYRITETLCLFNKIRLPKKWSIGFEMNTLENPKQIAEMNKLDAETMAIHLQNYAALRVEMGDSDADKYLAEYLPYILA